LYYSEFHVPTFLNALFHLRWCKLFAPPMEMEQTEYSEV